MFVSEIVSAGPVPTRSLSDRWCILRTKRAWTLQLAESLAVDGFEVWTPAETVTFRVPRRNSRRTVTQPMLPGYVFARASCALDLRQLSRDIAEGRASGPGRPNHRGFSLWLASDGAWSFADEDMEGLREEEKNARLRAALAARRGPKIKALPLPHGVKVRVKSEHRSFGGMIGRVMKSSSGNSKIQFSGSNFEWTIRTSLLDLDGVGQ